MRTHYYLENINVECTEPLASPYALHKDVPASEKALKTVLEGRRAIERVLLEKDSRMLVVVGPCSVHDPVAAVEYARRLQALSERVNQQLLLVMRVYFEKPRTTVGWKGLINDPHMDDSFDIDTGLRLARQLMVDINEMGLPVATEALDPISPQYIGDLVSWNAIGARTTESQTHREMASGLSTPVGFKNGTDGSVTVAVNAWLSASQPHAFLGVDAEGSVAVIRTRGNALGHIILRGGATPNHDEASVRAIGQALAKAGLPGRLVVDCSHGNSLKDHRRQGEVLREVLRQRVAGNNALMGVMLESNLVEGAQKACADRSKLVYGQSVTDSCIGWDETEALLLEMANQLRRD